LLAILTIAALVIVLGLIGLLLFFAIRKFIRFRRTKVDQEDLLDEIGYLNNQVKKLVKEKNEIMAMKVSQLGLKPDEDDTVEETKKDEEDEDLENANLDLLNLVE
jgi:flagellar biosynthesis/type III secretory pathway M-ring protein FliF/YscJ